jgi:hypothetical protein
MGNMMMMITMECRAAAFITLYAEQTELSRVCVAAPDQQSLCRTLIGCSALLLPCKQHLLSSVGHHVNQQNTADKQQ